MIEGKINISARRKASIFFVVLWVIVALFIIAPIFSNKSPSDWPVFAVILSIIWGGISSAVITVEIFRRVLSGWVTLSDTQHSNRVIIIFVLFVALIGGIYRVMVEIYG